MAMGSVILLFLYLFLRLFLSISDWLVYHTVYSQLLKFVFHVSSFLSINPVISGKIDETIRGKENVWYSKREEFVLGNQFTIFTKIQSLILTETLWLSGEIKKLTQ